ncbi:MAG TPA: NAD(P)H-hydrate dehydratase [Bacillales bacterium]|nr:NAD(P)H-hydrate dehydratase [Bacillales bacterium]
MHIVTGEEMNEIDRLATQDIGLAGPMLMENAGQAVTRRILERLRPDDRVAVMIGTGNNGGDGFVIARLLMDKGFDVEAWLIPPRKKIKGDARTHLEIFEAAGFRAYGYGRNERLFSDRLNRYTVIIDALLGTGISGEVRSPYKEVIDEINHARASVIAVDLPSGVSANGGEISGKVVLADHTVTLQCPKTGSVTYPSAHYYGTWETVDIGIPQKAVEGTAGSRWLWEAEDVKRTFPERSSSSHKGSHGKGLLVAGSRQMTGAVVLSAKAAMRGGAGLLTAALPDVIHPIVASQVTEATYRLFPAVNGAFSGEFKLDSGHDAVAVGPGIERAEGTGDVVEKLLAECHSPLIIDADGLFHLEHCKPLLKKRNAQTVLTPHPGEMARLIGGSVKDVQSNRFEVSREFAREYGVYLVLKGPYTIVATPDGKQYVNSTGNAALAKGGTGDVLTGLILAFSMQHSQLQPAVSNAVYLHGKTAEWLVGRNHSPIDVMASDVIEAFPEMMHDFLRPEENQ